MPLFCCQFIRKIKLLSFFLNKTVLYFFQQLFRGVTMRDRKKAQALAHELVSKMTIEERASQLKFDAPPVERLGVPAYNWWNEALHGVARAGTATMFPQPVAMASMFDPEMIRKIGDVVATEARAKYNDCLLYTSPSPRDRG